MFVAGAQVRSAGTVGGNIANASPALFVFGPTRSVTCSRTHPSRGARKISSSPSSSRTARTRAPSGRNAAASSIAADRSEYAVTSMRTVSGCVTRTRSHRSAPLIPGMRQAVPGRWRLSAR